MTTKPSSKSTDMLNGPIGPTIKRMTIPMILGMIMLMTFGLVDTFFIGLLGTEQLAAISFTLPVTFTLISLVIGLGIGTSAVVAKALGSGDMEHARNYGTVALQLAGVLVGSFAFILYFFIEDVFTLMGATPEHLVYIHEYMAIWCLAAVCLAFPMVGNSVLRASGDTKTPSIIMAFGGVINAVLDPILIFGWGPFPALGIQGAAIATLVAWAVGVFVIVYILAKRKLINTSRMPLADIKHGVNSIMRIGLPAAGANMLTPLAGTVLTAVVAGFGSAAVAAWGVGNRIESLASIVVLALSMSLPPFVSQNFGAGQYDRVKEAYRTVMKFVIGWQAMVWVVLGVAAPLIALIFAREQEVSDAIKLFMWLMPIGYGFQGIVILTNSSFNALHKPMQALVLNAARLFVFFVPFGWIGSYFWGMEGLYIGCILANVAIGIIAYHWFGNVIDALPHEGHAGEEKAANDT